MNAHLIKRLAQYCYLDKLTFKSKIDLIAYLIDRKEMSQ